MKILSNYDLGKYVSSKSLTLGAVQKNFLLRTTRGKFVLKYYENRSKNSVLFECSLVKFLNDKKYPCLAPLKNKQGKFTGSFNGKPYIISDFIDGEHIEKPGIQQRKQLVKKAAELHNLTKSYKPVHKKFRWNYNVELCSKLAEKKAGKINTKNSREKLAWFKKELAKIKIPESLPKGICHGDFHFTNVLFKKRKFSSLIDFDDANYTYLIFDLAVLINPFVSSFEWHTWKKFRIDENVFNFSQAKKTVCEYIKTRPLSYAEKKYLFDVYKLSVMLDCIWNFERGTAKDFFEKRKIEYLNKLGRKEFNTRLFSPSTSLSTRRVVGLQRGT